MPSPAKNVTTGSRGLISKERLFPSPDKKVKETLLPPAGKTGNKLPFEKFEKIKGDKNEEIPQLQRDKLPHKSRVIFINHYAALEIATTAGRSEIKAAHKEKVLEYHPEKKENQKLKNSKNKDEQNHYNNVILPKFEAIKEAFKLLSNPDERMAYDIENRDMLQEYNRVLVENTNVEKKRDMVIPTSTSLVINDSKAASSSMAMKSGSGKNDSLVNFDVATYNINNLPSLNSIVEYADMSSKEGNLSAISDLNALRNFFDAVLSRPAVEQADITRTWSFDTKLLFDAHKKVLMDFKEKEKVLLKRGNSLPQGGLQHEDLKTELKAFLNAVAFIREAAEREKKSVLANVSRLIAKRKKVTAFEEKCELDGRDPAALVVPTVVTKTFNPLELQQIRSQRTNAKPPLMTTKDFAQATLDNMNTVNEQYHNALKKIEDELPKAVERKITLREGGGVKALPFSKQIALENTSTSLVLAQNDKLLVEQLEDQKRGPSKTNNKFLTIHSKLKMFYHQVNILGSVRLMVITTGFDRIESAYLSNIIGNENIGNDDVTGKKIEPTKDQKIEAAAAAYKANQLFREIIIGLKSTMANLIKNEKGISDYVEKSKLEAIWENINIQGRKRMGKFPKKIGAPYAGTPIWNMLENVFEVAMGPRGLSFVANEEFRGEYVWCTSIFPQAFWWSRIAVEEMTYHTQRYGLDYVPESVPLQRYKIFDAAESRERDKLAVVIRNREYNKQQAEEGEEVFPLKGTEEFKKLPEKVRMADKAYSEKLSQIRAKNIGSQKNFLQVKIDEERKRLLALNGMLNQMEALEERSVNGNTNVNEFISSSSTAGAAGTKSKTDMEGHYQPKAGEMRLIFNEETGEIKEVDAGCFPQGDPLGITLMNLPRPYTLIQHVLGADLTDPTAIDKLAAEAKARKAEMLARKKAAAAARLERVRAEAANILALENGSGVGNGKNIPSKSKSKDSKNSTPDEKAGQGVLSRRQYVRSGKYAKTPAVSSTLVITRSRAVKTAAMKSFVMKSAMKAIKKPATTMKFAAMKRPAMKSSATRPMKVSAMKAGPKSMKVSAMKTGPKSMKVSAMKAGPKSMKVSAMKTGPKSMNVSAMKAGPKAIKVSAMKAGTKAMKVSAMKASSMKITVVKTSSMKATVMKTSSVKKQPVGEESSSEEEDDLLADSPVHKKRRR